MTSLFEKLQAQATDRHKAFLERLIPTVSLDTIVGVPMPKLRKLARELDPVFLQDLPHATYEENILHALLINRLEGETALGAIRAFLPYLDNWAVVDAIDPKAFYKGDYLDAFVDFIGDERPFAARLGIVLSIRHIQENPERLLKAVQSAQSGPYYVDMAMAWFFAEAALYVPEEVLSLLHGEALPPSVRRKTVRKIKESYRVPDAVKARAAGRN